jgi:hypothetical protein
MPPVNQMQQSRCRRRWRDYRCGHHLGQQRLARQRRRHTEERIAARVTELGFTDVPTYLVDHVVEQAWLLAEVAADLGAHRVTVRRLLDRYGVCRARRTPAEGRRPTKDVGCSRWGGRRAGRRGWWSSASRIWPATCRHGRSSRGGRLGGCGPSFGLAAGGWCGSWPGWGYDPDLEGRPPGCWASGGPQRYCWEAWLSAFLPGSQVRIPSGAPTRIGVEHPVAGISALRP